MDIQYNILWIDDEYDKFSAFIQECEEVYSIGINPYKTCQDGLLALERDLDKWDAVLLDAKMFNETINEVASLKGLGRAIQRLNELSSRKKIPYFIFTGQPDLLSSENFRDLYGEYYEKSVDEERLIKDIMKAVELSDKNQIRTNYQEVFTALKTLELTGEPESIFLDILCPLHNKEKEVDFKPRLHYTQLRKAIEYLFRSCNKAGLVPDLCISNEKVNLNQSSLYLAGKPAENLNIICSKKIIPEYIENIIRSILDLGNTASHTVDLNEQEEKKVDNLFKSLKSNYLIYGLTLQLCEVVVWFANYISTNADRDTNLKLCKKVIDDEVMAYIGKEITPNIDDCGYPFWDKCLLHNSAKDKKIKITGIELNRNSKTSNMYKYFAKFEIVSD